MLQNRSRSLFVVALLWAVLGCAEEQRGETQSAVIVPDGIVSSQPYEPNPQGNKDTNVTLGFDKPDTSTPSDADAGDGEILEDIASTPDTTGDVESPSDAEVASDSEEEDGLQPADTEDKDALEDDTEEAEDTLSDVEEAPPLLSCCEVAEGPNCDDAECAALICEDDPFCCAIKWDNLCVADAEERCLVCGGNPIPKGSCCEPGDYSGCETFTCEAQICDADPYCCNTKWDILCSNAANDSCSACEPPGPPPQNCCAEHSTPGCEIAACQDAVCAIDPYCCESAWDEYCVSCASSGTNVLDDLCEETAEICGCEPFVPTHAQLAGHWSPVWYHDTDSSNYVGDYFTAVDADGDLISSNNWESLDDGLTDLGGVIYWTVTETETHWYILYLNFHPQDWEEICSIGIFYNPCHENDMEGAMVVARKGSGFGTFEVLYTQAHNHLLIYTNNPEITKKSGELQAAPVTFEDGSHPELFVEAKGHGVCALHHPAYENTTDVCGNDILSGSITCEAEALLSGSDACDKANFFPGGDGIVYRNGNYADVPDGGTDPDVKYRLLPFQDHVWNYRFDVCNGDCFFDKTFEYEGVTFPQAFDGETWEDDKANPPWAWDSKDDGPVYKGDFFFRPAESMLIHLQFPEEVSTTYTYNHYLSTLNP